MTAIVLRTLQVSGAALTIAAAIGIPVGALLGYREFRTKRLVLTGLYTAMGLPPVLVGLVVFLLMSRQGPLGPWGLLFTPTAMIVAQSVIVTPVVAGVTMAAVAGVDRAVRETALIDGASLWQVLLLMLQISRFGVVVGVVAGMGRAISEVGAVLMVGGDIVGYTRVMTTAVAIETRKGNFELALAIGAVLLGLSFTINLALQLLQPGAYASST